MLIIGRKRDQKIVISDNIEITVLEIGRNRVRFGIQAPKEVPIHTKLQHAPGPSAVEVATSGSPTPTPEVPDEQAPDFQSITPDRTRVRRPPLRNAAGQKS